MCYKAVLASYFSNIQYVMCCKNEQLIRFIVSKKHIFNKQIRELMDTVQNKNLRLKDIKCVCTAKALMTGQPSAL